MMCYEKSVTMILSRFFRLYIFAATDMFNEIRMHFESSYFNLHYDKTVKYD